MKLSYSITAVSSLLFLCFMRLDGAEDVSSVACQDTALVFQFLSGKTVSLLSEQSRILKTSSLVLSDIVHSGIKDNVVPLKKDLDEQVFGTIFLATLPILPTLTEKVGLERLHNMLQDVTLEQLAALTHIADYLMIDRLERLLGFTLERALEKKHLCKHGEDTYRFMMNPQSYLSEMNIPNNPKIRNLSISLARTLNDWEAIGP